ncbi:MAG: dUTP diphosphatase [Campylobacterota bacterium]|nr:dUTP diphosphatase [Campylobacterota bacterium]
MNKISQMLALQQQLNDTTNGKGWEDGMTKNGKLIDWKRASYLECAELIESYPWKHWKNINAQPDYDNIKIEAVDIWHFIMSQMLQDYARENLGTIDDLTVSIELIDNYPEFSRDLTPTTKDYYEQIETVEDLMRVLFCDESPEKLMRAFIEVAVQSGLNLDSLYQLYIGKNILNKFRQDHGYKEGSYIKMWNGEEDNVVMQRILDRNPATTPGELYRRLEEAYPE